MPNVNCTFGHNNTSEMALRPQMLAVVKNEYNPSCCLNNQLQYFAYCVQGCHHGRAIRVRARPQDACALPCGARISKVKRFLKKIIVLIIIIIIFIYQRSYCCFVKYYC